MFGCVLARNKKMRKVPPPPPPPPTYLASKKPNPCRVKKYKFLLLFIYLQKILPIFLIHLYFCKRAPINFFFKLFEFVKSRAHRALRVPVPSVPFQSRAPVPSVPFQSRAPVPSVPFMSRTPALSVPFKSRDHVSSVPFKSCAPVPAVPFTSTCYDNTE